jgi:nickel-dependent lactate racemase
MRVRLQYGTDGLEVAVPGRQVTVLAPRFVPGLPDEEAAFLQAVRTPLGVPPLRATIRAHERIAIVIADVTRPLPSERLLPWILRELRHVSPAHITIVIGTGSHRATTPAEVGAMVGDVIASGCRLVDHSAFDDSRLSRAGIGIDGEPVFMNREYVEADRRIVVGFVEPHFMAGFSGGYKAVFPGVADIAAIMRYHDARTIGDPGSTWGVLEGNPTQARIRHDGALLPVDFCINVTLNRRREITGFYCGEVIAAHEAACAFSRDTAMVPCETPFPIVVTTNSGYPLDQNLYQAVKGMSAAAQIVTEDGYIATVARCNDGFPEHGNFKRLLFEHDSPRALLDAIMAPGFSMYDQWEAQLMAGVLLKARVGLYSELPPDHVRRAHLEPIDDLGEVLASEIRRAGDDVPIAVLPEGPMTIPYISPR